MERIFDPRSRPFDEIADVAVAIRSIDPTQRHVGIIYRDDGLRLLHLAWHCELRCEAPTERYFWVAPKIDPRRARQVAAICRQVFRANAAGGIPFAFSAPNNCFDDQTFQFLLGPSRLGLTCATFVLALFDRAGLPLIQYHTWPRRAGDVIWQGSVIHALDEQSHANSAAVDPRHIDALRRDTGAIRYRPEEVVAASTRPPAAYRDISRLAERIVTLLSGQPVATSSRRSLRSSASAISRFGRWLSRFFRRRPRS